MIAIKDSNIILQRHLLQIEIQNLKSKEKATETSLTEIVMVNNSYF